MNLKLSLLLIFMIGAFLTACSSEEPAATGEPAAAGESTAAAPTTASETAEPAQSTETPVPTKTAVMGLPGTLPTAESPTGTVLETADGQMRLSHPDFGWQLTLPDSWIITYDSGFQLEAQSQDGTLFARVQAQLWETAEKRLPNARAYVDHWKNFDYGDVFPLYADGRQLAETETAPDKFGGPYLQYEFYDEVDGVHYLQLYASAGGPASAMITVWTAEENYDNLREMMLEILNSFELVETTG